MKNLRILALAFISLLVLPGFTVEKSTDPLPAPMQPPDERKAQDSLPQSKDSMWSLLGKTKITVDKKKGLYKAHFPDGVKKLDGQTVKISGFMLPLESSEKFKHFLLSKRTPTCPFCPPGLPTEVIDVYAAKDVSWDDNLVTYEGKFQLTDQEEAGIFFMMTNATKK